MITINVVLPAAAATVTWAASARTPSSAWSPLRRGGDKVPWVEQLGGFVWISRSLVRVCRPAVIGGRRAATRCVAVVSGWRVAWPPYWRAAASYRST